MISPYITRFITRLFILFGVYVGGSLITSGFILLSPIFSIFLLPILLSPFYFVYRRKKNEAKCIELIREKFQQNVDFIMEGYHTNLRWGFFAITKNSVIFIPQKGNVLEIDFNNMQEYGRSAQGTGMYSTTTTHLGGGISMSGTQEGKNSVIYIVEKNGDTHVWHFVRVAKVLSELKIANGIKPEKLQSNF